MMQYLQPSDKTRGGRAPWYRMPTLMLAALALSACGGESLTCTLIGGQSGLTVQLSAMPPFPYTVEVLVPTSSPVSYVYRCEDSRLCGSTNAFFPGIIVSELSVRVTTPRGTRTTVARPVYTVSYPNGPSCEPRLTLATVSVPIPE